MTNEKKQEFTRRITQANKSQLVVILYELYFSYLQEAEEASNNKDKENFSISLTKAHDCLNELIASLNMDVERAQTLLQIYMFVARQIGLSKGKNDIQPVKETEKIMTSLYETYKNDAKNDTSAPVMGNAQQVYAGLTYRKGQLNENCDLSSRGYFA